MLSRRDMVITVLLMVILGACMHFVHDLFPVSPVISSLFPASETSWEHMKMIWYPFLAAGIILSLKTGNRGYFSAFTLCAFMAMMMQLGAFAAYQSYTGTSVLIPDIIIYIGGMTGCILLAFELAQKAWAHKTLLLWIAVAVIITACIIYLTFHPGTGYVFA